MAKIKPVWGIDVGHCALKAMKLVINEADDVELLADDYIEHAKILTQPDANPHDLIAASLEKFLSRNDITEDHVAISVPGQHTLARFSKLPPVDPKKIPDIVQFEANQQIPFDMEEVIWDYQTFEEEGSPEIEVGIFAMKRDLIHEHLAHFSDAGIEPMLMQSAPLAMHDALLFDGQCGEETTVLVDIGAQNTDLVITDKIRIWTRTIPLGGNNFTDALTNGFKLSFSKAENLKRQASSSKYARQIFQAMRPVFADLVGEIQRSIGFYTSTHREAKLDRIVGMGNAFKLPGLQKYLQQNLGMTVIKPTEFKNLKTSEGFSGKYREQVLSFGVAYGLALEGLDRGMMRSNLLPAEIARQVIWRKKKPWFAGAAACLALIAGMVWMRQNRDLSVLASNRGNPPRTMPYAAAAAFLANPASGSIAPREFAGKVKSMAAAFQKEHGSLEKLGKTEADQCDEVLELQKNQEMWLHILSAIHNSLPAQALLDNAQTGSEYLSAILEHPDDLARTKRPEVFIESLNSEYVDNVYADDYRTAEVVEEGAEELYDYYLEDGFDGFVVTLACRTPNVDRGKFIEKQDGFIQSLQNNGRTKDRGFYFDGVRMMTEAQTTAARSGGLRPGSSRPRGPSRGGVAGRSGGAGGLGGSRGDRDPLTFEDTSEDWRFAVKFVIALDNLPEEMTPGSPKPQAAKGRKPKGGRGRGGGRGGG